MSNSPSTRFILLSSQRTGSTWLADLLHNSRPDMRVYGEVFKDAPLRIGDPGKLKWGYLAPPIRYHEWRLENDKKRPIGPLQYLAMLEGQSAEYAAVGFKLMYNQFVQKPELLWPLVRRRYRIVHLLRQNLVDVVISRTIMRETGRNHTSEESLDTVQIRLDPQDVLMRLERAERRVKQASQFVRWLPVRSVEVTYEQLRAEPAEALNRLLDFLSLPKAEVTLKSQLKRANRGHPRDKIVNYDEIFAALRNTRFAHYLNSPEK